MYLEWVKWAVLIITLAAAGWVGYNYYYAQPVDGEPCERDLDCPLRVCLSDQGMHYCTRDCTIDADCREGWRCLESVRRAGAHCTQPVQ